MWWCYGRLTLHTNQRGKLHKTRETREETVGETETVKENERAEAEKWERSNGRILQPLGNGKMATTIRVKTNRGFSSILDLFLFFFFFWVHQQLCGRLCLNPQGVKSVIEARLIYALNPNAYAFWVDIFFSCASMHFAAA